MTPVGRHISRLASGGSGGGARRGVGTTVAGVACVVAVVAVLVVAAAAVAGDRTRPNDPMFEDEYQWALENTGQEVNSTQGTPGADIDATRAWNLTTGSRDVVVAILDENFDYDAEDLAANAWTNPGGVNGCPAGTHGYDVPTGACEPDASAGHGTWMGWVIGAVGDNDESMSGVNWTTSLMGVTHQRDKTDGTVVESINWVIGARKAGVNVRVINASWGWVSDSDRVRDAIARAGQHGILLVAAAGNHPDDRDVDPVYPCNFDLPNVICVAASDQHDELSPGSAYGDQTVHLAAPGRNICSSPYSSCSGGTSTSYAAAFVSGTAALVWSHDPGLSAGQVRSAILGNVDRLDSLDGKVITGGRLNVYRAMTGTDTTWPSPSESPSASPSESDSESPSSSESDSGSSSPSPSETGSGSESESPSGSSDSGSDGSDGTGGSDDTGSDGSGSSGAEGDDTGSADDDTDSTSATGTTGGDGDTDSGTGGPGTLLLYTDSFGDGGDGHSDGDSTAVGGAGDPPGGQASATGQPSTSTDRQSITASGGGTADTGTADDGGTVGGPAAAAGPEDGGSTAGWWWWAAALTTLGLAVWLARPFTTTGR